ncbi:MAG TPA: peptidylprolyl isomerase [Gammaproteobacteria bacterium]|nr:peptidylprolyl isomerase [Gammaproteobacteria bacterium]
MRKSLLTAALVAAMVVLYAPLSLAAPASAASDGAGQTSSGGSKARMLDRIVAVVNNGVILQSELAQRTQEARQQLRQQGTQLPPQDVLRHQVLEHIIMQKVQLQQADNTGIRVSDDQVNSALKHIAQSNGMTLDQFSQAVQSQGMSFAQFRQQIRDQLIIRKLHQRDVASQITVTKREVDHYLSQHPDQGGSRIQYHIRHILIALPEGATAAQILAKRKKAEEVVKKLRNGANFAQEALRVSDGQQALKGGDLGWRSASDLPIVFLTHLSNLKTGQVSDPIRSPSGFHIIKLLGKKGGKRVMVQETHVRQIMIKTDALTNNRQAKQKLEKLRKELEEGAKFSRLAKQYSDDTNSADKGGGLGWVQPNQMVPAFTQVMQHLKKGQISQPFQTRFGWHIIQVLGRRKHDATSEARRNRAREAVFQRKLQQQTQIFLRRMRDQSYIKILVGKGGDNGGQASEAAG